MMRRLTQTSLIWLLLLAVLALVSCADRQADHIDNGSNSLFSKTEESDNSTLISEGFMELEYAENFSVEFYEGGYRMLRGGHHADAEFLIVPETMPVPADLADHVQILQLPIDSVYISSTGLVSLVEAIDALDHVKLVSYEADRWYIDEVAERMDDGRMAYSGHYTEPNYEMMMASGIQFHIETTKSDDYPEVLEKFKELGIPSFVENSSMEKHPLGRVEWVKVFGVLFDREDEANAYFESQKNLLESVTAVENSGKTVAMGYVTSDDRYFARNANDYTVQLIEMAGGNYIMDDLNPEMSGSASLTFEEWYIRNKEADCLFYVNFAKTFASIQEMIDYNPLFADFKSVQNGSVWVTSPDFSQSTAEIVSILADMNTILCNDDPNITTDHLIKLP